MNLNLKNLGPLGFTGSVLTSKTSISILWKQIGNDIFYTSAYCPASVGVFRLSAEQVKDFKAGKVGLVPPGFCSPLGGKVITENHERLFSGKVRNKKHLLSIIEEVTRKPMAKKEPKENKGDEFAVEVIIPLNHKRTAKQKERLLEFIVWCIEDKLTEFNPDGAGDDETHADTHDIGSVILIPKDGTEIREICV